MLTSGDNYLTWTVYSPTISCGVTNDNVVIRNNLPSTASAGSDQEICLNTYTLGANAPVVGVGTWSSANGLATFSDLHSPTSNVLLSDGANQLKWTISSGVCPTQEDVVIIKNNNPTQSIAGTDRTICATTMILEGNTPVQGTGLWTSATATFADATQANTLSTLKNGENLLIWTISSIQCGSSSSSVRIINNMPSIADAGVDEKVCSSTMYLKGNIPTVGTGLWSSEGSTTATFEDATRFGSRVIGLKPGVNTSKWTITSTACGNTSDKVSVTYVPTLPNAGEDQQICNTETTLEATAPALGSGTWLLVSSDGTPNIQSSTSAKTKVTNLATGNNIFKWRITNACGNFEDEVIITNNLYTSINAGADVVICADEYVLRATSPVSGTGKWVINGIGSFVNNTVYNTKVINLSPGVNNLTWTITTACGVISDDLKITNHKPIVANAGLDQNVCGTNATIEANTPMIGYGR